MKKYLVLFLLLITACTIAPNGYITIELDQTPPSESSELLNVYFCPRDHCADHLLEVIESAEQTIHCALFDLDIPELITAFIEKSKTAEVRLVIDDNNIGNLDKFYFIRTDTSSQLSHNKFCIIDNELVWTGSFNPTFRGNNTNNNNAILIDSHYLAQNYEAEFNELWHGKFSKDGERVIYPKIYINGKLTENYFCPDDDCAYHINDLLQRAEFSIYFMTFSFTHDTLGDTLIERHNSGVKVMGIFEKSQNNAYLELPKLNAANIPVMWDTNPANMHHKVFIIDEKIVITGSMNPSTNGDQKNDENVIIFHDSEIAKLYIDEFWKVWNGEV